MSHELILAHMVLAEQIARAYGGGGCEDTRQDAYVGLCKAAKAWDATRMESFGEFARWHIRSEIRNCMTDAIGRRFVRRGSPASAVYDWVDTCYLHSPQFERDLDANRAIDRLDDTTKETVRYKLEGRSNAEIGSLQGRTGEAVRQMLSKVTGVTAKRGGL